VVDVQPPIAALVAALRGRPRVASRRQLRLVEDEVTYL